METFKNLMGFVLLGTVVYLFTILRSELVAATLAFCLVLALGAYLWGRYAHGGIPAGRRWAWRAAVAVLVGLSAFVCYRPSADDAINWEPFSLAALEESRQSGRNVVIDFTAEWCPNCRFVEAFRLETEEVRAALADKNVRMLKADITFAPRDSIERRLLSVLGSQSIPFLAVFPADAHYEPFVLRDIYSTADVLAILQRCPDA
jgi:thiol:disulfide interchange protein DsbD